MTVASPCVSGFCAQQKFFLKKKIECLFPAEPARPTDRRPVDQALLLPAAGGGRAGIIRDLPGRL